MADLRPTPTLTAWTCVFIIVLLVLQLSQGEPKNAGISIGFGSQGMHGDGAYAE